jgi:Zn-dependent protease
MSAVQREAATMRRPSPIFLAILAVFIGCGVLLWYGLGPLGLVTFGFVLAGWVVSLCLHEYAHAATAYHSGDRSVLDKGYLTLNPLRYSHPLLSIVLPLVFVLLGGIGLPGGAVYINPHALRSKLRESLVAAAGPLTNIGFTVVFAVAIGWALTGTAGHLAFWSGMAYLCLLQLTASILNLLPIPGLDGYGIAEPWLPQEWVANARKVAPFGILLLFALLWEPKIGRAFFSAIYTLIELLGVPLQLVATGSDLFRFWS